MRRVQVRVDQASADQLAGKVELVGGSGCITWHSLSETTGIASAAYDLYDGPPAAGQVLMSVTLSAGQSTRDYIGLHALPVVGGLFLAVTSGTVAGVIGAWMDHDCAQWYRWHEQVLTLEGGAAAFGIAAHR